MRVFTILNNFIDAQGNKDIITHHITATSLDDALATAAAACVMLQTGSECKFLFQTVMTDNDVSIVNANPGGFFKKQLTLYCMTVNDPIQNKAMMYMIRVVSPDPAILTPDGTKFDPTSPGGAAFVSGFLNHTTDTNGNAFSRVLYSNILQLPT